VKRVVQDIKENVCRVSETVFTLDEKMNSTIPSVQYELPDGKTLDVGTERFSVVENLFRPEGFLSRTGEGSSRKLMGVHQMVCNCIAECDADIRRELYNSIIVTGGNTLFPGFVERLNKEIIEISPQKFKLVPANYSAERKFSVWIGGSILGSLGTFQQVWMSKSEYEEHGSSLVDRKCP